MMGEDEGERTERIDGDGRGRGVGDGGGSSRERGKHPGGGPFVFGSGGGMENKGAQNHESKRVDRRPVSISYREKLLSLGGLGFLVSHEEADDIVSGWKGYFAKKNAEMEHADKAGKDVREEDMGEVPLSQYPVLSMTAEQYTA